MRTPDYDEPRLVAPIRAQAIIRARIAVSAMRRCADVSARLLGDLPRRALQDAAVQLTGQDDVLFDVADDEAIATLLRRRAEMLR